ncbi:BTB/POZ and MATH domain-containing protein 2-like [Aegilops tauschii subsp. strangulata]|uniref:BTB/POZ and MATH domain-containing protein 2-like n=1 Tax=Aegilops tauschii subsp. strangulata TaxID=200361 RepID=UPI000989F86B|nr:BTB/POZ and MATH domain-containing protein 2-like [Aegilops tauschii subsp. strangulata]
MSNSSPSSASAIVAKAVSGWHDLKIEGYSLTNGIGIGEFIRSETFVIAAHRWCIRYYPDGAALDDADWIAIYSDGEYVQRDDNTDGKDIMVKVCISVLDDGGQVSVLGKRSNQFDRCGPQDPAHRYIVAARSPVFMAELLGPMKGKAAACIRIDGMEAKVFKAMLHFIYADLLPEIDEDEIVGMAQHLLVAADRYNLERLKLMCEETLCKSINKDTAATTLALAEQHGCDGLKKACFKFLASVDNLKAAMASDGFAHLKSSCPSILEVLVTNLSR